MSSERALWHTVRKAWGPFGVLKRIENSTETGTPDLSYCLMKHSGWIELKHLQAWPKRATTPLVVEHFTSAQADWLDEWSRAGGDAWLLLQVGREYALFTAAGARRLYRRELTSSSCTRLTLSAWLSVIVGARAMPLSNHTGMSGSSPLSTSTILEPMDQDIRLPKMLVARLEPKVTRYSRKPVPLPRSPQSDDPQ